jgi:hypothetical protein
MTSLSYSEVMMLLLFAGEKYRGVRLHHAVKHILREGEGKR